MTPTPPNADSVCRLAMWSGPRNISTALMRSWGARDDTIVWDEPFYAYYLHTRKDRRHPGYEEILARHEVDWRRVVQRLCAPLPEGKTIFFQKQMAQHLLPEIDREWLDSMVNCLLIRDPAAVIVSFSEFIPDPTPEDIGFPQQVELLDRVLERTGEPPPVIDAADLLPDPAAMLALLCERIGVPYTDAMLSWSPGLHETDGAWAPHWYAKVAKTTGFGEPREERVEVPARLRGVLDACQPLYDRLAEVRLRVG